MPIMDNLLLNVSSIMYASGANYGQHFSECIINYGWPHVPIMDGPFLNISMSVMDGRPLCQLYIAMLSNIDMGVIVHRFCFEISIYQNGKS